MTLSAYIRDAYVASYTGIYQDPAVFCVDLGYTRHDTGETFRTRVYEAPRMDEDGIVTCVYVVATHPDDSGNGEEATLAERETSALALEASHRIARERLGLRQIDKIACTSWTSACESWDHLY